jgi:predicted ATP-dependent serine protease
VAQSAARLREAGKLGFVAAFIPDAGVAEARGESTTVTGIVALRELVADIVARSPKSPRSDLRPVRQEG